MKWCRSVCVCLDYDATGKLGSGVVEGTLVSLGDFGRCKQLSHSLYCLADISATQKPPGYNNAVCAFINTSTDNMTKLLLCIICIFSTLLIITLT